MRRKATRISAPATQRDFRQLGARVDVGFDRLVTSLAASIKLLQKEIRKRGK